MVDIARATCPRCGGTISADDPAGLCPRCRLSDTQRGQGDDFPVSPSPSGRARRRRRLTLALAVAAIAAIVLGGPSPLIMRPTSTYATAQIAVEVSFRRPVLFPSWPLERRRPWHLRTSEHCTV